MKAYFYIILYTVIIDNNVLGGADLFRSGIRLAATVSHLFLSSALGALTRLVGVSYLCAGQCIANRVHGLRTGYSYSQL